MKTTNIGIGLLTILVLTKYFISVNTHTSKDGSFQSGLIIDFVGLPELISIMVSKHNGSELLTLNNGQIENTAVENNTESGKAMHWSPDVSQESKEKSGQPVDLSHFQETLPMEHSHSLVVYDPANPVLAEMKTEFVDVYDEAAPLDNGNTLNAEMQIMMPRR